MKIEKFRKKKSLKGMTLAEVIISLAILSVMTVVLVGASGLIDKYIKSANTVNHTVATQLPVAEMKDIGNAHKVTKPVEGEADEEYVASITFSVGGTTPTGVTISDRKVKLKGILYEAEDPANVSTENLGGGLNMHFIEDIQYDSSTE